MKKNIIIFILILVLGLLVFGWENREFYENEIDEGTDLVEKDNDKPETGPDDKEKDDEFELPEEKPYSDEDPIDLPSVSIIIDDLGNNLAIDMSIDDIDADLTLAVLPFRDHTLQVAEFFSKRQEMILHLPLEPVSEENIEDRMLKVDMTQEEMERFLNESLKELRHYVVGVNNHKGSRFTSDREAMSVLLDAIKQEDLFFVDSFTIGASKGFSLAREKGIKTAVRDVFLDNSRDPDDIRDKLLEAVRLAEEKGEAIAIGHSSPETISVLVEEIPRLKERANFVPVSEVLR